MKKITVIGATSSLGINLLTFLVERGYKVFATYRTRSGIPRRFLHHPGINWARIELTEANDFTNFPPGDVVWLAHLDQGRYNEREIETNLKPFETFLRQTERSSDRKFIFISSGGAVYGEPLSLPVFEDHPLNPLSSYGRTKKALEEALSRFCHSGDFRTAIIRPGNIYGFYESNKHGKGIVAVFMNSIRHNTLFTLIDKGQTTRDFVHVDDVSRAVLAAIESNQPRIIWNVSSGSGHKISEVLDLIVKYANIEKPEMIHRENYDSDVSKNILSIDRILGESDWTPRITIEEGIRGAVVKWKEDENDR